MQLGLTFSHIMQRLFEERANEFFQPFKLDEEGVVAVFAGEFDESRVAAGGNERSNERFALGRGEEPIGGIARY